MYVSPPLACAGKRDDTAEGREAGDDGHQLPRVSLAWQGGDAAFLPQKCCVPLPPVLESEVPQAPTDVPGFVRAGSLGLVGPLCRGHDLVEPRVHFPPVVARDEASLRLGGPPGREPQPGAAGYVLQHWAVHLQQPQAFGNDEREALKAPHRLSITFSLLPPARPKADSSAVKQQRSWTSRSISRSRSSVSVPASTSCAASTFSTYSFMALRSLTRAARSAAPSRYRKPVIWLHAVCTMWRDQRSSVSASTKPASMVSMVHAEEAGARTVAVHRDPFRRSMRLRAT